MPKRPSSLNNKNTAINRNIDNSKYDNIEIVAKNIDSIVSLSNVIGDIESTLETMTENVNLAFKWANNPYNVPVIGTDFSAYHWSKVTEELLLNGISLDNLIDVDTSTVSTGDILRFDSTTGWIPYDFTQNQKLGFNTEQPLPISVGEVAWNTDESTLDIALTDNVTLQVGQEELVKVFNNTPSLIANGRVAMVTGTNGNSGHILIGLHNGTKVNAKRIIGIVTEDIHSNTAGFVTRNGKVKGLCTNGSIYGETWVDGDILYLKPNDNGALTNIEPNDSEVKMPIAMVIKAHGTNGTLYVRTSGIDENHDKDWILTRFSNVDNTSDEDKVVLSASKLTTPRNINYKSFDGTSDIYIEDTMGLSVVTSPSITIGTTGQGETIHLYGSGTITSLGNAQYAGVKRTLIFDSNITLQHNSASLVCPSGSNVVGSAGTVVEVVAETYNTWRVISVMHPNISFNELGMLDGVTSNIQMQLNTKVSSDSPTITGNASLPSTTTIGSVNATEIGYLDGVVAPIQSQLDSKALNTTLNAFMTDTQNSLNNKLGISAKAADSDKLDGLDSTAFMKTGDNASTATRLQTSRNITLAGALVGTVSFDGSSDVTINTTFGKIDDYELFIGGGSTVDGTSAINTLLATGKNVKLVGATKISGTLVIVANQVLFGNNSNEDKIYMDSASTFDIVALNGNYASIKGIGLQTLSIAPRTGGISIKVNKYEDNFIEDIKFTDQFIGIKIMRVPGDPADAGYNWEGATKTRITGCSFNRSSTSNVNAVNIWVDGGNDTFINKVVMDNPVNSQPKAGIRITCSQATWITDSDMIHCGKGLLIDPDVTGYVTWCFFNGMACDFGSSSGVSVEPTGACTIKGLFFNNCWVSSNGGTEVGAGKGRGIYLATGSSGASIDGVLFNGGNIFNNALQGIYIDGNVNNIGIESSNIGSNGHSANENDIHIASSTITGLTIRNNNTDIRMGFGKTSNYGIYVANILNNYVISNNNTGNSDSHYTSGMYINSPQLATNAVVIGNTNYSNYINGSTLTLTDSNGDITANKFRATSNGTGQAFQVGNDTWIGDVDVANTLRVSGVSNTTAGYIQFGNSTDGKSLGRTGTGALTWGGATLLTVGGGYIDGDITLYNGTADSPGLVLNAHGSTTWVNDNWNGAWRVYRGAGVTPLSIDVNDVLRSHNNKVWHEGNCNFVTAGVTEYSDANNVAGYPHFIRFTSSTINTPMTGNYFEGYVTTAAGYQIIRISLISGNVGQVPKSFERANRNGTWSPWVEVWNSGSDGSGSGLDADLLDGIQSTSFLRSDADQTAISKITFEKNTPAMNGGSYSQGAIEIRTTDDSNPILGFHRPGKSACALYENGGQLYTRNSANVEGIVITTANTGFSSSATANTVVVRNQYGNIYANDIINSGVVYNNIFKSASGTNKEILYTDDTFLSIGYGTNYNRMYKNLYFNNDTTDSPELIFSGGANGEWEMDTAGGQFRLFKGWSPRFMIDDDGITYLTSNYWTKGGHTTTNASNMYISSTGAILRSTSSKKYKTDIQDIDKAYIDSFFNNARPIFYRPTEPNDNHAWGYWGFIAEEVAEYDKRLVHWRYDGETVEVTKTKLDHPYEPERIEIEKEEIVLEDGTKEIVEKKVIIPEKEATYRNYTTTEFVEDKTKPMIAEGVQYERITVLLTAKVQEQEARIKKLEEQLIQAIDNISLLLNKLNS